MPNFYINEIYECPITDIFLGNNKSISEEGTYVIKINKDDYIDYIYYKKNNITGKFYEEIYYYPYLKFLYDYDYNCPDFSSQKLILDIQLSNPFIKYYNYIKDIYFLEFVLSFILLLYNIIESYNPKVFDYFKIIGYFLEIIVLILEICGFILFIKSKHFILNEDNKDIFDLLGYNISRYKKLFNMESFLLSFEIVKIIFEIFYIIFPEKFHKCNCEGKHKYSFFRDNNDQKYRVFYLFLHSYIIYVVFFIVDIINDNKIKKYYSYFKYNWETNPITSIDLSSNKDYEIGKIIKKDGEYRFYEWKSTFFHIEKLKDFNYYNIYEKENGKLCGKDSFENNLYFPEDIECPINDIIITDKIYSFLEDYNRIPLGKNNEYLYYTNKRIDKNIIIDIRINHEKLLLNFDNANDLCDCLLDSFSECKDYNKYYLGKFYNKMDSLYSQDFFSNNTNEKGLEFYSYQKINLNSIFYLGIDSEIINERGKISGFSKNMKLFNIMIIFKYISLAISIITIIAINTFLLLKQNNKIQFIISILLLILIFGINIIYFISLYINIKYVKNFMEKITPNFQNYKNNYVYSISIFINEVIIFFSLLTITIFTFCFKEKKNARKIFRAIEIKNQEISLNLPVDGQSSERKFEKHLCILCLTNPTKIILYPCRHKCICEKCYARLKNTPNDIKNCPICRKDVASVIDKVYEV